MNDWSSALDVFERNLAQVRAVLDDGTQPDQGMWPPADLTSDPIPAELLERAEQLLAAANELERALVDRRDSLPDLRPATRRRRKSGFSTMSTEL